MYLGQAVISGKTQELGKSKENRKMGGTSIREEAVEVTVTFHLNKTQHTLGRC